MRYSTLGSAAVLVSLALGDAFAHEQDKSPKPAAHVHAHQQHSTEGHSEGSKELHRIMMQGRRMPMPMSGDVDQDFAAMMTMHHRQAIEMSDVLLKHGKDADLKALARKMQASQVEEIEKLEPHTK